MTSSFTFAFTNNNLQTTVSYLKLNLNLILDPATPSCLVEPYIHTHTIPPQTHTSSRQAAPPLPNMKVTFKVRQRQMPAPAPNLDRHHTQPDSLPAHHPANTSIASCTSCLQLCNVHSILAEHLKLTINNIAQDLKQQKFVIECEPAELVRDCPASILLPLPPGQIHTALQLALGHDTDLNTRYPLSRTRSPQRRAGSPRC